MQGRPIISREPQPELYVASFVSLFPSFECPSSSHCFQGHSWTARPCIRYVASLRFIMPPTLNLLYQSIPTPQLAVICISRWMRTAISPVRHPLTHLLSPLLTWIQPRAAVARATWTPSTRTMKTPSRPLLRTPTPPTPPPVIPPSTPSPTTLPIRRAFIR